MNDTVQECIERFKQAEDAYSRQRLEARSDLRFVAGEQWSSDADSDEMRLTINLLNPFLRQITAEARQANPAVRIVPVGGGADVELAEIRGGLIRNIEQASDAESVYQKSLWYAAASGEGYVFIDSEYCSDTSFDQDLFIRACENPEKVFLDPNHVRVDGTDAEWAIVVEDVGHDYLKRQFPRSEMVKNMENLSWNQLGLPGDWIAAETVRLVKYWVKERVSKKIWLVMDPLTMEQSTVTEEPAEDMVVLNSRDSFETKVKCYLMNAVEVLEETTWPGRTIPIFKTTGDSFYVGGERIQYGAVRHAKDPQRQYNYFTSRQTEMVDMAPKNSFVGADGQFENHEKEWSNANRVNYSYLAYNPISLGGTQVPPPTRVSGLDMASFQGVAASRGQSLEDLKLVFGLHDAALGRMNGDASGIALQNRVEQSSRSTYHYFDNLLITIKAVGRALNELIPFFYDTDRLVRIVHPTDEEQIVAINSMSNKNRYDMTKGDYEVIVDTGPAYASKRQEAYTALSGLMQALPEAGQFIGDLVASQIDSPVAQEAAARIKASIPPEILAATGDGDDQDMAPKELLQKTQQELSNMQQKMKAMELEKQELEIKVKIATDKAAMELTKADMQAETDRRQMEMNERTAEAKNALEWAKVRLEEQKLALSEKQLQIQAAVAASQVAQGKNPDNIDDITD